MRIFLNIFLIFSFTSIFSQDYQVVDTYDQEVSSKIHPYLTFRNYFLQDDYILGGELGFVTKQNFAFFGVFDIRPFKKKILEHQSGNLFYQHAEQRYFIGIGAEYIRHMHQKPYGIFLQINGNYTWADYGGQELTPPKGFVFNPKVGAFFSFYDAIYLKAGYAYLDTGNDNVGRHRLYIAFSLILRENETF